jgi:CRP-like cAMP-binding protein
MKYAGDGNRLLTALARSDRERFVAGCARVDLQFGDTIHKAGERISHVYFPIDGFISLITALDEGAELEVGIVGDEGMLGTSLVLGVGTSAQRAIVQGAGATLRMSAAAFERHCRECPELRTTLQRYIDVLMSQLAQTAACTGFHMVEARLARWLLASRDRAHRDQFRLTHEFLAYMLGVRRVGVTQAARSLQEQGLIDYRRGDITILDDAGLRKASCSCYARGNRIYEQAFGLRSTPRARKRSAPKRRIGK